MKFDASTISEKKRAEWAEVERQCALNSPPVGAPVLHNGQRMIWFVGADLHVDGYVFAQAYGMGEDASQLHITAAVNSLLGDVRVVFDADML